MCRSICRGDHQRRAPPPTVLLAPRRGSGRALLTSAYRPQPDCSPFRLHHSCHIQRGWSIPPRATRRPCCQARPRPPCAHPPPPSPRRFSMLTPFPAPSPLDGSIDHPLSSVPHLPLDRVPSSYLLLVRLSCHADFLWTAPRLSRPSWRPPLRPPGGRPWPSWRPFSSGSPPLPVRALPPPPHHPLQR